MNVNLLEDNPDWKWYLLFAGGLMLLTLIGWLMSKHYPVRIYARSSQAGKTNVEHDREKVVPMNYGNFR